MFFYSYAWYLFFCCLNICVPAPNPYVETLTPKVVMSGNGALGGDQIVRLEPLMTWISALHEKPREPANPSRCVAQSEKMAHYEEMSPYQNQIWWCLEPMSQPPELREINFCWVRWHATLISATGETEARGSQLQGQPLQFSEMLCSLVVEQPGINLQYLAGWGVMVRGHFCFL